MGEAGSRFTLVESVRCLECGDVYPRTAGDGTVAANPGCPRCGYVGWIPLDVPAPPGVPRRSVWDPRPRPPR